MTATAAATATARRRRVPAGPRGRDSTALAARFHALIKAGVPARDPAYRDAYGSLFTATDRLIRRAAYRAIPRWWPTWEEDAEDLYQEGAARLPFLAERFEPDRAIAFSTFVTITLRRLFARLRAETLSGPIRVANYASLLAAAAPADADRAAARDARRAAHVLALDEHEVADRSVADAAARDRQALDDRARLDRLDRAIDEQLDPRSRDIVLKRFGLRGRPRETLAEIGAELKITNERVRQLEDLALRVLTLAVRGIARPARLPRSEPT
jgi:RNA polymerase sigma factor (sigma-70 family)